MVKKSICLILVLAIMVPLGGCKKANEVLSAGVSREILDDDKVSMDRRPNEHSNSDIEGNGIIYVGNRLPSRSKMLLLNKPQDWERKL